VKTRLNKHLADRGICSRRKADALIASGAVLVNGKTATLGMLVDETDDVRLRGGKTVAVARPKTVYYAFHKPVGIITSVDPRARDSVLTAAKVPERVFPVGRLDVASSGLLLLTNDGRLSERITHPRYHHEKEYVVSVSRPIGDAALERMAGGMMILGSMTKPARVTRVDDRTFRIVLTEGRNRQIRRMCEAVHREVTSLRRVRVMNVLLGDLPEGATRPLTAEERDRLLALLDVKQKSPGGS
jgi:23S rRNA pseudouridine2604 synthase